MLKNLAVVVKASQVFVNFDGDRLSGDVPVRNALFETISDVYIPLLNMFDSLERDNVPFRIALVLPPVLCAVLDSSGFHKEFGEWLDRRIALGGRELERCAGDSAASGSISRTVADAVRTKSDFFDRYEKRLVRKFCEYQRKGFIEILATGGTGIFIPHYSGMDEILSAEIETGIHAYRSSFGEFPDGFWLPEEGYVPGAERIIRSYGFNYTILDSRAFLFSETPAAGGIFRPARTDNSLVVFADDFTLRDAVFGQNGYCKGDVYMDLNRDIGFELPVERLSPFLDGNEARCPSGFCYWNQGRNPYDAGAARKRCAEDARLFLDGISGRLERAGELLPGSDFVSLSFSLDADMIRREWREGICWLENVLRSASDFSLNTALFNEMLGRQFELQKIRPYYSSSSGYGETFLSGRNSWMLRYTRKACERMTDLAERFPKDSGLKARLLNIGAKELLIALSSDLARMLDEDIFPEYARRRFEESIKAFTAVFDALGSNTVSTEWLTRIETRDAVFPWMNYRIFSRKR